MKFVNRHQELKRLKDLAKSKTGGFGVVWGRRRVGKTRLLLEWTQQNKGVYFVADSSAPSIQRKFLSLALEQALEGFSQVEYPDWHSLFTRLALEAKRKKWRGPLVIDELPYLIFNTPELPSILQKFIDHEAKSSSLILVFCGSSQRMMQGAILDPSAPLYGRADQLIKLKPIAIGYMKQALSLKNPREIIESYAIWGGIPRYWELSNKIKGTLHQKIDQLVLDPMGPLSEEPQRLLLEEFPSALILKPILDAIGLGATRLSEIASRIGEPVTSLNRSVERLIELDLVQKELPYGADPENSKKTLYKIKDPFLRFWFKVVAPKRSVFSQVSQKIRFQWLKEGLHPIFSILWEELCREALPKLSENWDILYGQAGRFWQGQGKEWDIVSQSHDGSRLLLGEAKWTEKTPKISWVYSAIEQLKRKGAAPIPKNHEARLEYVFFLPEKPKNLQLSSDVKIIDAKDVINVLF